MNILVTNDDGIASPALYGLREALKGLGRVFIVAPDRDQSATSHSLTLYRPMRIETPEPDVYAVDGTPTDCVLVATHVKESTAQGQHEIQWLAGVAAKDSWGPITIPPDQFMMLGDNRDNSADSRYIGLVPRQLLIGRAERILVSADILEKWQPRFERFGRSLY